MTASSAWVARIAHKTTRRARPGVGRVDWRAGNSAVGSGTPAASPVPSAVASRDPGEPIDACRRADLRGAGGTGYRTNRRRGGGGAHPSQAAGRSSRSISLTSPWRRCRRSPSSGWLLGTRTFVPTVHPTRHNANPRRRLEGRRYRPDGGGVSCCGQSRPQRGLPQPTPYRVPATSGPARSRSQTGARYPAARTTGIPPAVALLETGMVGVSGRCRRRWERLWPVTRSPAC